jgi:HK97 family phage major capsid protein
MINLDERKSQLRASLQAAMDSGEENKVMDAVLALGEHIQGNVLEEARNIAYGSANDAAALAARGVVQLTADERKYYNAVISGNMGGNAFDGAETLPPPTVINRVFEYLAENHELLRHINFRPAAPATEFILRAGDVALAYWGSLSSKIRELNEAGFKKIAMNLYKLSCYLPVSKSMLELGPEWLDRYVREVLAESMAMGLEKAIVDGDGKECPVGMIRNLEDGNYPVKTAIKINDLEPVTLGTKIMAPLSNGGKRTVRNVIMVVNPLDYWEKIFGATTYLNNMGQYVFNILPIPGQFVQSSAMPAGKMCAGIADDYFMGVGFQQYLGYSDEHRYIEDERVYLTKVAANGRPLDNDSFHVFDITGLKPALKKPA